MALWELKLENSLGNQTCNHQIIIIIIIIIIIWFSSIRS
jgi:hypothetical protein